MADNPMLGQLQAEYEGNPHFADLADEVAKGIIDCSHSAMMDAIEERQIQMVWYHYTQTVKTTRRRR